MRILSGKKRSSLFIRQQWNDTIIESSSGHLNCMELLIKVGADVNKPQNSEDGETPLMRATKEGHVKCVELLLKSGADVNMATVNKNCNVFACVFYAPQICH